MAAYYHPFVFDSVFSPVITDTTNTPCFYQNYQIDPPAQNQNISPDSSHVYGSSCPAISNLSEANNKQSTGSSPPSPSPSLVLDKLETTTHQITHHNPNPTTGNKRKLKDGSNTSSAQSKKQKKKKKEELAEAPAGYIHVRARRGQATDSHSLAERVRREKISERMKQLQSLVPGCDKITGKALMLDEIINYVHSLQYQVEFLSMKLGCENPMLYDFGMDLDSFMLRPVQSLSSLESGGQNSNSTTTNNNFNYYPLVDTSTATSFLLQQQAHIPNMIAQSNGQFLWDVGGNSQSQRKIMMNESPAHHHHLQLSSNLSSFHI